MADSYEYTNVSSDLLKIRASPARPGQVFLTVEQRHVEDPETAFVALSPEAAADVAHQLFLKSGRSGVIVMRPDAPEDFTAEEAAQAFLEAAGSSARIVPGSALPDLPAEDLVEPGDEVPALCELADRVAALESRVSKMPLRYRDQDSDVWETVPGTLGEQLLDVANGTTTPYDEVLSQYGPLTPFIDGEGEVE